MSWPHLLCCGPSLHLDVTNATKSFVFHLVARRRGFDSGSSLPVRGLYVFYLRLPAVFLEVLWFPTAAPQKRAHNTHCDPDE